MLYFRTNLCITLCIISLVKGFQDNETSATNIRQPRVSGRIVKLYSGPRPQPVQCTREGFQPDPMNCAVFYRCVNSERNRYNVYRFQCGPGTIYDPDTEVCNFPQNTKRLGCGAVSPPSVDSYTSRENEIDFGQPALYTISTSKPIYIERLTDEIKGTTVLWPPQSNSFSTSKRTFIESLSEKSTKTTRSWTPTVVDQYLNSRSTNRSTPVITPHFAKGDICTADGFVGDKDDCSKFYRCVSNNRGGYIRYEFSCSKSTIWDEELQACNYEWATKRSGCGAKTENFKHKERDQISHSSTQLASFPWLTSTESQLHHNEISNELHTELNYGERVKKKKHRHHATDNTETNKDVVINHELPKPITENLYTYVNKMSSITTEKSYGYSYSNNYDENVSNQQYNVQDDYTTTTSTMKSTNSGNKGSECTSNGFMGDLNDCNKFYRCVDDGKGSYLKYEFNCAEGTLWDPKIEACNHAWAVKDCNGSAIDKITTISVSSTNQITEASAVENPEDGENNYNNAIQTTTAHQTQKSTTSTTTSNYPQEDVICAKDGFVGDPRDCKRFYRCVDNQNGGFIQYEFICGDGTVWDSNISSCNHENLAQNCTSNQTTYTSQKEQTSTVSVATTPSLEISNDELVATTKIIDMDKSSCLKEGFFANKNDCRKFYRCVNNAQGGFIKYEFVCGDGTKWDSELQTCNHPKSAKDCGNDEHYQNNVETTSTTESYSSKEEGSTTQSINATILKEPIENDVCESEGFFGDSKDCTKFYRCVHNAKKDYIKYEFVCGEGTAWDQNIQACNHASSNKACSTHATNNPIQESQIQTTTMTSKVSSTTENNSATATSDNAVNQCTNEGFFANPIDCTKFYRCVDNGQGAFHRYEFSCGEGTAWVQDIQACDHKSDAMNCENKNTSITESYSSSEISSSTAILQTSTQQNDEYPSQTESNSSNKPSNDKRCHSEGYFGDEDDCKKFYRCVDNGSGRFTKYDFVCGEGTAWDTNLETCNHENEVHNCNSKNTATKPVDTENDECASSCTSQKSTTTTQSSYESPSESEPQISKSDKCEKEGYFGNKNDCKKFYRCVDNGKGGLIKYDFDCGEGTIWDQDITTCNHPGDVVNPSCSKYDKEESSTKSPDSQGSTQTSTIGSASSTTEKTSNCSEKEPQKNTSTTCPKEGFYANKDDCKKFYRCVDWDGTGKKFSVFHFDCGEGTIWDPELETCNYEDSVYPPRDCANKQSVSETTTENKIMESTEGQMTQESTTTTTTQEETTTQQTTTQKEASSTTETITTTESSTTQQEMTTQPSTTEPTTLQSTTESNTTQQSITESNTTQQTTTENETTTQDKSTTQQSTTEKESSTQETTTEQTTMQQSTTEKESTPDEQTTEQISTTQQSTTEESTNKESTTEQQSTSDDGTTTNESTTEQGTTMESSTDSTQTTEETTTESSSNDKCPETEDDQNVYVCPTGFKRHPKYCNMFYQCDEDDETHEVKIAVFTCPNNTIYDEDKTQCVEESKTKKKCKGEKAEQRRFKRLGVRVKSSIVVGRDLHSCSAPGHYPFEKKDECSPVFLKCSQSNSGKFRSYVYRCPANHVYWSISRRCEPLTKVVHCRNLRNDWYQRREIPVERKNVSL